MSVENNRKAGPVDEVKNDIPQKEDSEKKQDQVEKHLNENTERFRHVVDSAPLGVFTVDVQGRIKYINSILQKKFGLNSINEAYEQKSKNIPSFVAAGISDEIQQCLEKRRQSVFEHHLKEKDGETSWLRQYLNPIFNKDGSIYGVLGVAFDITALRKSENDLRQQLGFERNAHMVLSRLVKTLDIDEAINSTLSYLGELSKASRSFLFLLYEDNTIMNNTHEWCANGISPQIDNLQKIPSEKFSWWMRKLRGGDSICYSDISVMPDEASSEREFLESQGIKSYLLIPLYIKKKLIGFIGYASILEARIWKGDDIFLLKAVSDIFSNFLERKIYDDGRKEKAERFKRLAQASLEGIVIIDKGKIIDTNHVTGTMLDYEPSELIGKKLVDFVEEKEKSGVQKIIREKSSKPVESLIKKKDGSTLPVEIHSILLSIEEEPLHVIAMRDISERKRKAKTEQKDLDKIKKALHGSIKALATAIGLRDPFTEGHGLGVAHLACAIAQEMGLSEDQIEGIRIAAIIHDIGKISIPVEILNKPGKITEAEFMIVKNHSRVGYDLLKNIEFPWPIAKIVLQHHERMDGSGYPDGISGSKILLEARILAVAEVIHSILSNRSYRPPKSIVNAIEEISKNKGKLYDPNVVDAALKIVTKEGFTLNNKLKSPAS